MEQFVSSVVDLSSVDSCKARLDKKALDAPRCYKAVRLLEPTGIRDASGILDLIFRSFEFFPV